MELIFKFQDILKESVDLITVLGKQGYLDIDWEIRFRKEKVFVITVIGKNLNCFYFALKKDFNRLTKHIDNCMYFEDFKWLKIAVLNFIKGYEY